MITAESDGVWQDEDEENKNKILWDSNDYLSFKKPKIQNKKCKLSAACFYVFH